MSSSERIRRGDWLAPVPGLPPVPTMLLPEERRLLHFLARKHFQDLGSIIDAGCFLGGSTLALAHGLRQWSRRTGRSPRHGIESYDLFTADPGTSGRLLSKGTKAGESFRARFEENVRAYRDLISTHAGDIVETCRPATEVEIFFVDCAKCVQVSDFLVRSVFPRLVPGQSIVVQQDYFYHDWNAWIHISMERLAHCFEILTDTGLGSLVFLNTRPITPGEAEEATVAGMTAREKLKLMAAARARFRGYRRMLLERSHAAYRHGPAWFTGTDPEGHAESCSLSREIGQPAAWTDWSRVRNRLALYGWRCRAAPSLSRALLRAAGQPIP